ncbi:hypothetical protein [Laspinema olomoucense]|uniref:hypothetical protein n=1 Tax=Laspinema olomoucense TaxID=3231600 RepID=UPI0021BA8F5D|nr:hypothetical protein [Laspinema sp. D3d]
MGFFLGDSLRDSSAYLRLRVTLAGLIACMEPGANLFLRDLVKQVTADTLHPLIPPDVALASHRQHPTLTLPKTQAMRYSHLS